MITTEQVQALLEGNAIVVGSDGEKIGDVGEVFLDTQSGEPEWVTAKAGLFGMSESVIPLRDATVTGAELRVQYDKDTVRDAPGVDVDNGRLTEDEESTLYAYYGLPYRRPSPAGSDEGAGDGVGEAGYVGGSAGGTSAGDADFYVGGRGDVEDAVGTVTGTGDARPNTGAGTEPEER